MTDTVQGDEKTIGRGTNAATGQRQYPSALERLKARSPEERWQSLGGSLREPVPAASNPQPSVRQPGVDEEPPIGLFEPVRRPATPEAEQLSAPGRASLPAVEQSAETIIREDEELEMPREFPAAEMLPEDDESLKPTAAHSADAIYQEIEEEFPRIRIEPSAAPPVEEFEPVEQPVIEPSYSTIAPPAHIAQVPAFDAPIERQPLGELVANPRDLKPLSGIQPYFDYEPDKELRETDPYRNVFPRPDGVAASEQGKQFPEVVDLGNELYQHRNLAHVDFQWVASDFWHYPLYFEDVQLERYGHTYNEFLQPFVSFGKFGVQFFGLPYQMSLHPICQEEYVLGWYRPGECAPYKFYQIPLNADAAIRTGAFYTGMVFAFP